MGRSNKDGKYPFVKYYTGLSYLFSPAETRFILHMADLEYKKGCGYIMNLARADYMKIMGLNEYSFDKCAGRLVQLGLLSKTYNAKGNRVYYSMDMEVYGKLVKIACASPDIDKTIGFCRKNFLERSRTIESITEEEIHDLKNGRM